MKIIYSETQALKEIQESPKKAKKHNLKSGLIISGCSILFASMILFLVIYSGFLFHCSETAMVSALMFLVVFCIWFFLIIDFKYSPEDLYSFSTDYYLIIKDKQILNTILHCKSKDTFSLEVVFSDSNGIVASKFINGLESKKKVGIEETIVDLKKGVVFIPYKEKQRNKDYER